MVGRGVSRGECVEWSGLGGGENKQLWAKKGSAEVDLLDLMILGPLLASSCRSTHAAAFSCRPRPRFSIGNRAISHWTTQSTSWKARIGLSNAPERPFVPIRSHSIQRCRQACACSCLQAGSHRRGFLEVLCGRVRAPNRPQGTFVQSFGRLDGWVDRKSSQFHSRSTLPSPPSTRQVRLGAIKDTLGRTPLCTVPAP